MAEHNPLPAGQGGRVTLATVVESLGPDGLDVWAAPHGLEVPVSGLAVRESDDDPPRGADLRRRSARAADPTTAAPCRNCSRPLPPPVHGPSSSGAVTVRRPVRRSRPSRTVSLCSGSPRSWSGRR